MADALLQWEGLRIVQSIVVTSLQHACFAAGLAHAVPAAADLALPQLLQDLHSVLLRQLGSAPQQAQQQQADLQQAGCPLLAALTAEGLRRDWLTNDQVTDSLALLLSLLGSTSAAVTPSSAPDGLVVGAAAAALRVGGGG